MDISIDPQDANALHSGNGITTSFAIATEKKKNNTHTHTRISFIVKVWISNCNKIFEAQSPSYRDSMVSEAVIRTYQIHMWHVSHIHRVIVEEGESEAEARLPRGLKIDLVSASVPQKFSSHTLLFNSKKIRPGDVNYYCAELSMFKTLSYMKFRENPEANF